MSIANVGRELAVVVPCFNEAETIRMLLKRVLESPLVGQVIVVDDGSSDGSADIAHAVADEDDRIVVVVQPVNRGKGAALRRGFELVTMPYAIVQDADLEYDPQDYPTMIEPLASGLADVVFGSRFMGGRPHRVLYFWHSLGNRLLTTLSNMATDLNLTDMETCFKAFRAEVLAELDLREDRFGIEPEITAKVARGHRWRIYEVGISYAGRTYAEGKKIGWRDGIEAVRCIVTYSPVLAAAMRRLRRR